MAGLDFEFDLTEIYDLVGRLANSKAVVEQEMTVAGRQSGMIVTQVAMGEAPVDSGNLKNNISPDKTGMVTIVTSHADYSKAVHDGTKAYDIFPRNKKALMWEGAKHPVKKVHHKAKSANPFMARALSKATPRIESMYEQAETRIATKLLGG